MEKDKNGLNDDVRVILDSYNLLQSDKLTIDEQRVFKNCFKVTSHFAEKGE